MIINDLESHIAKDGEHAIFTGTFDPSHVGHAETVIETIWRLPQLASVVAIPHSWDSKKKPFEINIRIRWLIETLKEFIPDLSPRIVVCHDLAILEQPAQFDELCKTYRSKLYRVVGSDKVPDKIVARNNVRVILASRRDDISSTIIRRSIEESDVDQIRAILAKSVLEDILANNYYG